MSHLAVPHPAPVLPHVPLCQAGDDQVAAVHLEVRLNIYFISDGQNLLGLGVRSVPVSVDSVGVQVCNID